MKWTTRDTYLPPVVGSLCTSKAGPLNGSFLKPGKYSANTEMQSGSTAVSQPRWPPSPLSIRSPRESVNIRVTQKVWARAGTACMNTPGKQL